MTNSKQTQTATYMLLRK